MRCLNLKTQVIQAFSSTVHAIHNPIGFYVANYFYLLVVVKVPAKTQRRSDGLSLLYWTALPTAEFNELTHELCKYWFQSTLSVGVVILQFIEPESTNEIYISRLSTPVQ